MTHRMVYEAQSHALCHVWYGVSVTQSSRYVNRQAMVCLVYCYRFVVRFLPASQPVAARAHSMARDAAQHPDITEAPMQFGEVLRQILLPHG